MKAAQNGVFLSEAYKSNKTGGYIMDFSLTDEQKDIQKLAKDFAAREIAPNRNKYGNAFPGDLYRRIGEMGFLGCIFPEKYGGTETGFLSMVLIIEEITKVMPGIGYVWNANNTTGPYPILQWGTEEQRQKYIPDLISARKIGFNGLTEPGGGSDVVGGIKTRAVRQGDHYILNGTKMFISNAGDAALGIIYCKTDPGAGHRGISAFIVETDTPGFSTRPIPMRILGRPTAYEISLEDVKVPKENLLGKEGNGFTIAMHALDHGRITVAARVLAISQGCLEASIKYCNEREAFGQKIGNFQMIQRSIAEMVAEIEASRLLIYQAAHLMDRGETPTRINSIAKYFASEVCMRAAQHTFEIFGGYAFADEYPISDFYSYAQLFHTGEGSANIQRVLIAQDALGWKKADRHKIERKFRLKSDICD